MDSISEIERKISEAVSEGYRGKILARGQARSMIWKEGKLPEGAPAFSLTLSYDLKSYAYALLELGLRLQELGGSVDLQQAAFEHASNAIETVITNGDSEDEESSFHRVICATSYHLARFSARSYSILKAEENSHNFSILEKILSDLILRDLEKMEKRCLRSKIKGYGSDEAIASFLNEHFEEKQKQTKEEESEIDTEEEIAAINMAVEDNFMSAMLVFLLALESGDKTFIDQSLNIIKTGLDICAQLNLVPQWWIHRLTLHLLIEIWESSFHVQLPLMEKNDTSWHSLRRTFISLLYCRKKSEIDLWPSQIEAAGRAVKQDQNLVVSLPTSAGKTRIAELCILRTLSLGKRVIFVTPLRALSAQTEVSLQKTFLPLGKSISALYGSIGTSNFEENALRHRDIVVATPEKLDFAIRNDPSLLDDVGLVVLDEGHMIGLGEREVRYEVQIQRLLRRPDADQRRIVCLSAILPEGDQLNDFVSWISKDTPNGLVQKDWRPTRLRYGEVVWGDGQARLNLRVGDEQPFVSGFLTARKSTKKSLKNPFPNDQKELTLATAWKLAQDGQSVLVYCPERRSVEPFAEAIIKLHKRGFLPSLIEGDGAHIATARTIGAEWLGQDHPILKCLDLGVAIHHGALPTSYRKEIERLLRDGVVKVVISSPTLAQGLNLTTKAVIMHSLFRSGEKIDASEFKNVVGRAGRAFVDIEGLILHPIFDQHYKRTKQWEELISQVSKRNMESGLLRLVMTLLVRIYEKLGKPSFESLIDYIVNNAQPWNFPELPNENDAQKKTEQAGWEKYIASLDTAIFSMLGEQDCDVNQISAALDTVLSSSLWARRLQHKEEKLQVVLKTALEARAKHLWANSTQPQRKGYFFAGIGLNSGKMLDAIAQEANVLLVSINSAIIDGNQEDAIQHITDLAEKLFSIPPFAPDNLPTNWKEILKSWLSGKAMAEISADDPTETLRFIEEGLVYRLPWGIDAIRVRAQANGDLINDFFSIEDFEIGLAVPCIECGTLNQTVALLMQAGFSSRQSAMKAVQDTNATFTTAGELEEWLKSDVVKKLEEQGNWPTKETAALWKEFTESCSVSKISIWKDVESKLNVEWQDELSVPKTGSVVRVHHIPNDNKTLVLSPDGQTLGHLKIDIGKTTGLLLAKVSSNTTSLDVFYTGPDDLTLEQ